MGWLNKQNEIIEWKYHNQNRSSTQSTSPGTLPLSTKELGRRPTFEWTKVYLCPFNGKPKTFKGVENAGKPTKASQRVGCKASLRVQKKFDSEKITVTIKGAHSGHILRSNDTRQKMRMTPEVCKWLAKSVATGVGWKGFKETYRPNQQQSEILLAKNLFKNAPAQASDMQRVSNMDFNNFRGNSLS
ncbi:hypothetical protein K3495_g14282 [Podosphaera aphanis]|nr:hypothetical protein K3495_g14282 [Podosphaera aphanis]